MKLAFVSTIGYPWGGSEILWTATAKLALQQGHEVLVSVFDWPEQPPEITALKTMGASMHYRRRFYPVLSARIKKKLLNRFMPAGKKKTYHDYLLHFKPERIFFNLAGGDEIINDDTDLMVLIRQLTIPFIAAFHSLSDRPQLRTKARQNYIFQLNKAEVNLFTSRLQLELLQHQVGLKIPNARLINHPLRVSTAPIPVYPAGETIQFAVIGSLVSRWKGQDILLKIFSQQHWLQRQWVLNIYGDGEDRDYLTALALHYGISDKVIFYGHEMDLHKIWKHNHILLIPSRQDSGPIVCFEAMYFARPVVGSYMGAMPEYIIDGETGTLAAGIAEADYEKALEKAWANRERWKQWGEQGKSLLNRQYDFHADKTLLEILQG